MCRLPLALLFPSVFGNATTRKQSSNQYQYGSNDARHVTSLDRQNTGSINWEVYGGPPKAGGKNQSIVHHSAETSEEYILSSVVQHQQQREASKEGFETEMRAIRKTTQYAISYERDPEGKV
jgi:hypothetical protein